MGQFAPHCLKPLKPYKTRGIKILSRRGVSIFDAFWGSKGLAWLAILSHVTFKKRSLTMKAFVGLVLMTVIASSSFANFIMKDENGKRNSMCLTNTRNVIASMEEVILMSNRFSLKTIDQQFDGKNHSFVIESVRESAALGKKIYLVDVNLREVGMNREVVCEVSNLRSYIEE